MVAGYQWMPLFCGIPFYTEFYGNPCKKVFDVVCDVQ